MKRFQIFLFLFLTNLSIPTQEYSPYQRYFPARKLITEDMEGDPVYNRFSEPGVQINPYAFQSPMYPRYGQSSMLPAPPSIFHDGALPIMNIYELHHPTSYTSESPYGLPYVYNPYHGMNLPYNYLHHPYAPQIMTTMSANELASENYDGENRTYKNKWFKKKLDRRNIPTIYKFSNSDTNARTLSQGQPSQKK